MLRAIAASRKRADQQASRKKKLDEKLQRKHEAEELKFQAYFDDFDTNKNGILSKPELVKLLHHLQPDHVFPDKQLDEIVAEGMEMWKEDHPGEEPVEKGIARWHLQTIVQKQLSNAKEKLYVDGIFDLYDADKSGFLDREEMISVLKAAVSGEIEPHFDEEDENFQKAKCLKYKLECLGELHKRGILDNFAHEEKRNKLLRGRGHLVPQKLVTRAPEPEDIEFVVEQCDNDSDGKISKSECLTAISLWIQLAAENDAEDEAKAASKLCLIM